MENRSREVDDYMKSKAFRKKEKQVKKFLNIEEMEEKDRKISADERDRVLNKARPIIETGKGERLNPEEEGILKEIVGGILCSKKAIEILDNKKLGGNENER